MAKTFPEECGLYVPGHQTHLIQLKVKANKPKFPATVELIDLETLAIKYNDIVVHLKTHDALGAQADSLSAFDNEISFAPEASLLYIRRSGPTENSSGSWRPYYLAEDELEDCSTDDEASGYFEVGI